MPLDDEPFRGPVPKAGKRVVDKKATGKIRMLGQECCVCQDRPGTQPHHVVYKGQGGSDVPENMAPVCGSGSDGCHGAIHGNPYTDKHGHRWTQKEARKMIGIWILSDPARLQYALDNGGAKLLRSYDVKELKW